MAPAAFAVFLWWFSTGVIIYLDGLPRRSFRWSLVGASLLALLALYGLHATRNDTSLLAAYLAFASGLALWGWQEITFLMGYITGPRKSPCEPGCKGLKHFWHATETILYHELAIAAGAVLALVMTLGGENTIGLWTYLILWIMRLSAKLNLFLGVRNVGAELLPEHMRYLEGFLRKKAMNWLFPIVVLLASGVAALLVSQIKAAPLGSFEAVGATLLAGLLILAILEHLLMVLPLPSVALWNWSLRSHSAMKIQQAEGGQV